MATKKTTTRQPAAENVDPHDVLLANLKQAEAEWQKAQNRLEVVTRRVQRRAGATGYSANDGALRVMISMVLPDYALADTTRADLLAYNRGLYKEPGDAESRTAQMWALLEAKRETIRNAYVSAGYAQAAADYAEAKAATMRSREEFFTTPATTPRGAMLKLRYGMEPEEWAIKADEADDAEAPDPEAQSLVWCLRDLERLCGEAQTAPAGGAA